MGFSLGEGIPQKLVPRGGTTEDCTITNHHHPALLQCDYVVSFARSSRPGMEALVRPSQPSRVSMRINLSGCNAGMTQHLLDNA